MRAPGPRVGFVLEKALGHATHADNLERLIGPDDRIRSTFAPIEFEEDPRWSRVPGYGNWTVRAGIRARRAVRAMQRGGPLDALFVHTQVPAMLMPDRLRRLPSVVSLDATPIQYDELGAHYDHATGSARAERLKWRLHRSCFAGATTLVTWAEWTKTGLVERYEVPADKVVVIPPGVDAARWATSDRVRGGGGDHVRDEPVRVLFVGADLARKGGHVLVEAVRRLRAGGSAVELDLVTRDDLAPEAGVIVHRGLGPNSSELIELYRRADIFCLPTRGDCLPMVLSEAGAVGLPLVSTNVGAIAEICRDGETGLIVPPDDDVALAAALQRLVDDPALRHRFGDAAQELVRTQFDAGRNARLLVDVLVSVARGELGR